MIRLRYDRHRERDQRTQTRDEAIETVRERLKECVAIKHKRVADHGE